MSPRAGHQLWEGQRLKRAMQVLKLTRHVTTSPPMADIDRDERAAKNLSFLAFHGRQQALNYALTLARADCLNMVIVRNCPHLTYLIFGHI